MNFLEEDKNINKTEISKLNNFPKENESLFFNRDSSPVINDSSGSNNLDLNSVFDFKTILIFVLAAFLILTILGINIFTILGNSIQNLSNVFGPFITNFLKALGYSSGTILNTSADTVSDVAKTSIDIAEGSIQNIGNLLIASSGDNPLQKGTLEDSVTKNNSLKYNDPKPDDSSNSIQKPITSDKNNWCLVGEFENKRGCVPVTDSDKCLSGQIFPNQAMCLNPTLTP